MPVATCVVRLSEVAPDGTSALVATGVLNLTHRLSDTDPSPMPTGGRAAERSGSRCARRGYRFAAGHRIRLTVLDVATGRSLWPSPFPGELRVHHGVADAVAARPARAARRRPRRLRAAGLPDLERRPHCARSGSSEEDPPEWRIEEDVHRRAP